MKNFSDAPYTFNIIAWAQPGFNYNSNAATIQLLQLAAVTGITTAINQQNGELSCSFSAVENAAGYEMCIVNSSGTMLASSTSFTTPVPNEILFVFSVLNFSPFSNQIFVVVICTGGSQYIPSNKFLSPPVTLNWGIGYSEIGSTFNIS